MSTRISNNRMTSDTTKHHAWRIDPDQELWEVSWLPGDQLTRNEATTAMVLAETVATHVATDGVMFDLADWLLIHSLAAELDLSASAAIASLGA